MTKAYIIARVTVKDPEAYARYVTGASTAMARYGAKVLARGGAYEALEGEARPRNVILEFDSMNDALAYWNSDLYQAARKHREGACEIELCAVQGAD